MDPTSREGYWSGGRRALLEGAAGGNTWPHIRTARLIHSEHEHRSSRASLAVAGRRGQRPSRRPGRTAALRQPAVVSAADVRQLLDEQGLVWCSTSAPTSRCARGPGPADEVQSVRIEHHSLYPDAGDSSFAHATRPADSPFKEDLPGETATVRAYLSYLDLRPDSLLASVRAIARADRRGAGPLRRREGSDGGGRGARARCRRRGPRGDRRRLRGVGGADRRRSSGDSWNLRRTTTRCPASSPAPGRRCRRRWNGSWRSSTSATEVGRVAVLPGFRRRRSRAPAPPPPPARVG